LLDSLLQEDSTSREVRDCRLSVVTTVCQEDGFSAIVIKSLIEQCL